MFPGQILAATNPPYHPATVYGHQMSQGASAAIAFAFIGLIALLIGKVIFKGRAA